MKESNISNVAVVGASGYGGIQLIKLLKDHPSFEISFLGGASSAGKNWNDLFPFLPLDKNIIIEKPDSNKIAEQADYAILSLPNGLASKLTPDLLQKNVKVLDLSADYRYSSINSWSQAYMNEAKKYSRNDHDICEEAIYGLPEFNSHAISESRIVALPGCYPTASLLSLIPFLNQGLIETDGLIIDAKSGTSGGGRTAKEHLLLAESSDSLSPYGVLGHRHTSEIEEQASIAAGSNIQLQFTPHLIPMVRGILVTIYARLRDPGLTAEDCCTVLKAVYRNQPFIEILPVGVYPMTKWVKYTNRALISVQVDKRNGRLVIMTVIDNLLKGQAGQGVQCLNLMHGIPQEIGLPSITYYP